MVKNSKIKSNANLSLIKFEAEPFKNRKVKCRRFKRVPRLSSTRGTISKSAPLHFFNSAANKQEELKHFFHIENKIVLTKYNQEILELYNQYQVQEQLEAVSLNLIYLSHCKYNDTISYFKDHLLKTIDVCIASYQGEEETFFLTNSIIDKYLQTIPLNTLTKRNFTLISLTAFRIASKMEDLIPLSITHIQNIIGKKEFSAEEIQDKEIEILNALEFNLDYVSVYDIIKTYFCDFVSYAKETNIVNELNKLFSAAFFSSVVFAKICSADEKSKRVSVTIQGLCCIILAVDFERSKNQQLVSDQMEAFFHSWINIVIKQSGVSKESFQYVYEYIKALFISAPDGFSNSNKKRKLLYENKSKLLYIQNNQKNN